MNSPLEDWDSESYIEEVPSESVHVDDGPTDTVTCTLQECFVGSYNSSCNSFIGLVSETYNVNPALQLRVYPKKLTPTANIWPPDQIPCHPDPFLDRLYGIANPIHPINGIERRMDERILVRSPTHMTPG